MADDDRPLSALPSPLARGLAFASIVVAGLSGALIGWAFVDLQCDGSCATPSGIGAVVGGVFAAGGVAVVAVLALRAMGEWKRIREAELFGEEDGEPQGRTSLRKPSA
ncbi:MAG TPA: hypothetical protein VFV35_07940 [Acidimicrobiales bacterium]|nr:hypothetical protein [Acidimicrobiales bacterium]